MTTTSTAPTLEHLADLLRSVTEPELAESVRAARARTFAETLADLRDVAGVASHIIGGSRALDMLRATSPEWTILHRGERPEEVQAAALDRIRAREVADQLRASQLTSDTPGVDPRPVDVGRGTTGIGSALPLVRRFALRRDFTAGGTVPVVPGIAGGDTGGDIRTEGSEPTATPFTIADVGSAEARFVAAAVATFSRQVRDWSDPDALAMLDQVMLDIADRAGETHIASALVTAAGGTHSAATDLATAVDAAESAAGAAVAGGPLVLVANPADWPAIRRAVSESWRPGLPAPVAAASTGVTAGTAVMFALDAVHLFAADVLWLTADRPSVLGVEVSANRPLYFATRAAAGIQTITGIA